MALGLLRQLQREGLSVTKQALCATRPGASQDRCTIHLPKSAAMLQIVPIVRVTATRDVVESRLAKKPILSSLYMQEYSITFIK